MKGAHHRQTIHFTDPSGRLNPGIVHVDLDKHGKPLRFEYTTGLYHGDPTFAVAGNSGTLYPVFSAFHHAAKLLAPDPTAPILTIPICRPEHLRL